jgi:hypothetical protein
VVEERGVLYSASPKKTTTYTAFVTDKYGCINSDSIYIAVIQTSKKFYIYPNPSTDKIQIIGANIEDGTWLFRIVDLSGITIVTDKQIQATNKSLFYEHTISDLKSGTYLLIIGKNSYKENLKFIKLK